MNGIKELKKEFYDKLILQEKTRQNITNQPDAQVNIICNENNLIFNRGNINLLHLQFLVYDWKYKKCLDAAVRSQQCIPQYQS